MAISLASAFVLLSAFHIVGAFGFWSTLPIVPEVPGGSVGRPSSLAWLFVAAALALETSVVLARGDIILTAMPRWLSTTACVILGAVFMLRSMGDFRLIGFFKEVRGTDFAFYDTWLYTPLCVLIGLGAPWLAITRRGS